MEDKAFVEVSPRVPDGWPSLEDEVPNTGASEFARRGEAGGSGTNNDGVVHL